MSAFQKLSKHYPKIPGYRRFNPRRCQVFAVGSAKTGTHSLAAMFDANFRTRHEAEVNRQIALYARKDEGRCDDGEIEQWFIERSRRLWLECDVSHLHGYFASHIARALPDAKFILTLREPYSWLDSAFNQTLGRPLNHHWSAMRQQVYGRLPEIYPEQESVLQQHGLYPIAALLNRWAERIEQITQSIPAERLLIVKTRELKQSTDRIADFCGIPCRLLSAEQGHQFRAAKKIGLLDGIDRDYIDGLIQQRCGVILAKYFSA